MADRVEVTQADRALHREVFGFDGGANPDAHTVVRLEAFARHRHAALEEAAKVADGHVMHSHFGDYWAAGGACAARDIATAIRNLKGPSHGQG